METESAHLRIREALELLTELVEAPCSDQERAPWIGRLHEALGRLEHALGDETSMKAEFFKETARAHPRLRATCAEFFEDGRQLLRQATSVVMLSTRAAATSSLSIDDLRLTTTALINAVVRHQHLASELVVEAGQDIGGQG